MRGLTIYADSVVETIEAINGAKSQIMSLHEKERLARENLATAEKLRRKRRAGGAGEQYLECKKNKIQTD
jgi:hypothetical protein